MTGDARGEAERVAHYYLRMIERASTGSNRQAHRDELVAALAAAIDVRERSDDAYSNAHNLQREMPREVWDRFDDALSALRARAGEET